MSWRFPTLLWEQSLLQKSILKTWSRFIWVCWIFTHSWWHTWRVVLYELTDPDHNTFTLFAKWKATYLQLQLNLSLLITLCSSQCRAGKQLQSIIRFAGSIARWYVLGALCSVLARKSMWWVNLPTQFAISGWAKSNHWIEIILKGFLAVAKLITSESLSPTLWITY